MNQNQYIYENHDVTGLIITEGKGANLKEGVLARVKGSSFFLDGYSRNGRFYPKKLWENALKNPETKSSLARGLMFGCIGHPKDYSLDELLESGRVSHKVIDSYIDKQTGEGIAEYEILDTPSGRILNTILRSGSDMYVSTRAFGGFSNETKSKDGKKYKILDINNFVIESIDFVIQPGFLETNPKIMESLMEEFRELKEKDELNHIDCEDGICGLKLEGLNEVSDDTIEENNVTEIDKEMLGSLNKEELILTMKNIVSENKILSKEANDGKSELSEEELFKGDTTDTKDSSADMMVSAKLMMNYVSYVELLNKMVRYNVEYEKYYDRLIEFLDKDSKLTTDDMASLDSICDDILKEKDVEESIMNVCERIKELASKINDDGEKDDKDKEDKEGKKEDPKKKDKEEDDSTEVKAKGESIVDFMWNLKERVEVKETILYEEDEEKVRIMESQLLRMKDATIALTRNLEEAMSKEPEKEIITETKIEFKVPDDINEKFVSLTETVATLTKDKEYMETKVAEYKSETEKTTELYEELESGNLSLKEQIVSDKSMFKEILEDKANEMLELEDKVQDQIDIKNDIQEVLKKTNGTVDKLGAKLLETSAKFYSSYYKLELPIVEKLMDRYSDESKLKEALYEEEKLNKRHVPVSEIKVPEYTPQRSVRSDKKSKFLENLTR